MSLSRYGHGLPASVLVALAMLLNGTTFGQCAIQSSTGYEVHVVLVPTALIPSTDNCPWGYNYNVQLSYDISFTGTAPPGAMYTLQGNIGCGSTNLFFNLPNGGGTGTTITTSNPWRGVSDCNSATLQSLGCSAVQVRIEGPGITSQLVECSPMPLPVELLSFQAHSVPQGIQLQWSTATETNNARFVVERSTDGELFLPVLERPGAGNSMQVVDYEALDGNAPSGISYYRLTQEDFDGATQRSPVVAVEHQAALAAPGVHPNPNRGTGVQFTGVPAGSLLEVMDGRGQVLHAQQVVGMHHDMPPLASGIYLLRFTTPEGRVLPVVRYMQV